MDGFYGSCVSDGFRQYSSLRDSDWKVRKVRMFGETYGFVISDGSVVELLEISNAGTEADALVSNVSDGTRFEFWIEWAYRHIWIQALTLIEPCILQSFCRSSQSILCEFGRLS